MISLFRPSERQIRAVLRRAASATPHPVTPTPPAGYTTDTNEIRLGEGAETFERACAGIRAWQQFALGWAHIAPHGAPIAIGTTVAVVAHTVFWTVNPARVVAIEATERRFSFTYATLPEHVEQGYESFTIAHRPDTSVWYEIVAVSRPQHPLVWLGYPFARAMQRRFARDSKRAMAAWM